MKIEWTPWFNVPMHCRFEVLGVAFLIVCAYFVGSISFCGIFYSLCFGGIYWKIIALAYVAFICYDYQTCDTGGRRMGVSWVRSFRVWKWILNYFPIDLVKTADLPSDRNYLICIFPHGILSFGACANFGTSHSKWDELFPKIRPKLTTLRANFMVPGFRELLLTAGLSSASENSLKTLLSQSNDECKQTYDDGCTSNAVGLVVGGIREVFYTHHDRYQFVVAKRRGFIRIALQTGASLVPAISFGENNVYKLINVEHGFWRRLIEFSFQKYTDRFAAIQNGRGFLQYNFGMLPIRHAINTVIGAPIHLDKISNPSDEIVNRIHQQFCSQLMELFETHKMNYVKNSEHVRLELI